MFDLTERIAGIVVQPAKKGELVLVLTRKALTSLDGAMFNWRLEELHGVLFSRIPIQAGEPVYTTDILELRSYDLGVPIPPDCALVVVRSHGWRRALFYDFGPLMSEVRERTYDLSAVLAEQTLSLLTGKFGVRPPVATMQQALADPEGLLSNRCKEEARYQELLERYPWLLGGQHTLIERHTSLDDRNIPDFTGVRARDGACDLFEIKQPFLQCFRKDGHYSANFLCDLEMMSCPHTGLLKRLAKRM